MIYYYSTAATDDAAYIIGGSIHLPSLRWSTYYSSTISEFKNGKWRKLGELIQGRHAHGSISMGQFTMVVGGTIKSG